MFWGEKKRAWAIHVICPLGDQKQFLSNSLWEGDLAGAKKHFQENKCEGKRQGPPFSPIPGVALPGLAQQPRARRTGGQTGSRPREPLWENPIPLPLGKQKNLSVFGDYFRNSNERDLLLLSAPGAEKELLSSWVGDARKVSLPEDGRPPNPRPGLQLHVHVTCTAALAPLGASPHLED